MRSERIQVESITPQSASEVITDAFDMVKEQRKQERKSLIRISVGVLAAIALFFLGDSLGWMGMVFAVLPCLCFAIAVSLVIYGIIRSGHKLPCTQTIIWAVIFGSYPVLLFMLFFLVGALGLGPVPT